MAVEYAERFAIDHTSIDDAFFDRLHEQFDDGEILDLTICIATFAAWNPFMGSSDGCDGPTAEPSPPAGRGAEHQQAS